MASDSFFVKFPFYLGCMQFLQFIDLLLKARLAHLHSDVQQKAEAYGTANPDK